MSSNIDYRLLDRLTPSSGTPAHTTVEAPAQAQTAFGRRILALSQAFHTQSLTDEQIEGYLVELVGACEMQWTRVEDVRGCSGEKGEMIDFLEGIIEIAENFDLMSHPEVQAAVAELEGDLMLTLVHLGTRAAA